MPPYLSWIELWLDENRACVSNSDWQQIGIAVRNNWYLIADIEVNHSGDGTVTFIPYLEAHDPDNDIAFMWRFDDIPRLTEHQQAISDLLEGRYPPQCHCRMCIAGENIPTESMHRFLASHQDSNALLRAHAESRSVIGGPSSDTSVGCFCRVCMYERMAPFNFQGPWNP